MKVKRKKERKERETQTDILLITSYCLMEDREKMKLKEPEGRHSRRAEFLSVVVGFKVCCIGLTLNGTLDYNWIRCVHVSLWQEKAK